MEVLMSDAQPMSDTPPTDQPTAIGADFTSTTCGASTGGSALTGTPLMPEAGWLAINGNSNLEGCVIGSSGALVTSAYVTNQPPRGYESYAYGIWVFGQGPAGFQSGTLALSFTDEGGSDYSLRLFSSTPAWHYVNYNSDSPGIIEMRWEPSTIAEA
jgi:hypothetical protein